ncbi:MAG: NAD(P)/FAD-dependent oxidoreductase [Lachnospiraceae bacterium]|nr:NAD(P)/FAD-dependent oxidoreductase [Lachnospiraceae bacterium]
MKKMVTEIAIIGAGPAGLCAAIEASRLGAHVTLIDENAFPGGQLFKQIHKFFGSREHMAGTRGYEIGQMLLKELESTDADVMLGSVAYGIFDNNEIGIMRGTEHIALKADKIIIAAGGKENYMPFPGSTLPGVMGAGAAQTMINVNRVLPGKNVLMLGSGNVGLIVSYQLMQAGANVKALVEAAPNIGGYGVHAGKIRRAGVPILVGHTITEVYGDGHVEGAVIAALDEKWNPIPGSERAVAVDTVCLAVGLNPMTELAWMAGCEFTFIPALGGHVPMHNENMETTKQGIYVAGDITGVEEASSAMEEGKLAGIAAAAALGHLDAITAEGRKQEVRDRVNALRTGLFGERRRMAKETQVRAMQEYMETRGERIDG